MSCTRPAALTPITQPTCEVKFDQVIRLAFQRRQSAAPFANEAAFKLLSNWTALLAAADETKVTVSPLFAGMTIPQSEGLFEGGNDNTTIDGNEVYKGEGFVKVTGTFTGLTAAIAEELRTLTAESAPGLSDGLTLFMINREGDIIHDDAYRGIPVSNFRISSVGSEGYGAGNKHAFSFSMAGDWDAGVGITTPSFNPRFDL